MLLVFRLNYVGNTYNHSHHNITFWYIGPFYTGGEFWAKNGSSCVWLVCVWMLAGGRIIRLGELSALVRLKRRTIAMARVDGWSVCLPVFVHRRIIRRATVLCPGSSQTDDSSSVKIGPLWETGPTLKSKVRYAGIEIRKNINITAV